VADTEGEGGAIPLEFSKQKVRIYYITKFVLKLHFMLYVNIYLANKCAEYQTCNLYFMMVIIIIVIIIIIIVH